MFGIRALIAGAVAVLAIAPAHATFIYDTIHPTRAPGDQRITLPGEPAFQGSAAPPLTRGGPIALEFNVASDLVVRQIQLVLNTASPVGTGTVTVSIIPDDVSNPGNPSFTGSGLGLTLTNKIPVTSFLDSSLMTAAGGSLITLDTAIPLPAGEYWLALEDTPPAGATNTGTAQWIFDTAAYTAADGAIGTSGQSVFWQGDNACPPATVPLCGTKGVPATYPLTLGVESFEAAISTPEPASLAILGAGLAGLGLLRRRRRG